MLVHVQHNHVYMHAHRCQYARTQAASFIGRPVNCSGTPGHYLALQPALERSGIGSILGDSHVVRMKPRLFIHVVQYTNHITSPQFQRLLLDRQADQAVVYSPDVQVNPRYNVTFWQGQKCML